MKRIEILLKIAGMKFEFQNLEIGFHKRQVSFLVVKAVKCKSKFILKNLIFFQFKVKRSKIRV